jgi:hypothetical protein
VLAGGLGPFGKDVWPGSAVVVGLFAAAGLLLLRARWTDPAEQVRAAGLGFVGVAGLAVAAAVGIGRAGTGPEVGFASRYAVFGVLPLVAAYFALLLYGPARFAAVGRAVGVIVAILVICFAVPPGLTYGDSVRYRQRELYYAVKSGASPDEVAARCVTRVLSPNDTPTNRAALADGLRVLERHHLGCYRPRGK